MPILEVKDLNIEIAGSKIIKNISLTINKGDVLAIIGPNGAGKTMLLKALLGFIPFKGKIDWEEKIKLGYVPQRLEIDTDIPLTVKEFFRLRGRNIKKEKISEILKFVQLDEKILNSGFGQISIGQRQRILIAWAMLDNPDVLLFDEPTADIDIAGQESIYKMLYEMQNKTKLTIILVSHDLNIVYRYAEKILCLNKKQICIGTPQEILQAEKLLELYGGEKAFYQHKH